MKVSKLKPLEDVRAHVFQQLLNGIEESIFIIDAETSKFLDCNNHACETRGYTKEEILSLGVIDLEAVLPDNFSWKEHVNHLKQVRNVVMEGRHKRKDGSEFPHEVNTKYVEIDGNPYVIAILRDITDKKKHELEIAHKTVELEKLNQSLDKFSYIVSHDLKAPLRAIDNLSQWIEEDLGNDLPDTVKQHIEVLQSRVKRMAGLIDGVLQYSRIGRESLASEKVDTKDLVRHIADVLVTRESKLTVDICDSLPVIYAPRILIDQVFSNLISNAVKYNDKEEGKVRLKCDDTGDYWVFSVKDNGPGIPVKYQTKVFGIFQTIESRDTKESTGIGLSIVKKIVEEMGGEITLDSKEGEGCEFKFSIKKTKGLKKPA